MDRLLLTLTIIFASLFAGYALRLASEHGFLTKPEIVQGPLRKRLQACAIYILMPLSAMLSLWGLPAPKPILLILPLLGLVSYLCGGILAILAAHFLDLDRAETGSLFCCGTFTNVGAVGSLVCVLFLGENSIALVALYRLLEEFYFFSVSIPVAQWFSPDNKNKSFSISQFKPDPLLGVILGALLLGITFNLLGLERPQGLGSAASWLVIAATVSLLFTIGIGLRLLKIQGYARQSAAICGIKFVGVPVLITSLARSLGLGEIENGLPLKVVAVLSAMPVAMTSLVPPALFNLDLDLANACWIYSTLGLLLVLPLLLVLLPML